MKSVVLIMKVVAVVMIVGVFATVADSFGRDVKQGAPCLDAASIVGLN